MVYIPRLPSYVYEPGLKRIPTSLLREGRSEYMVDRGQTLAELNVEQEYGEETPTEALDMQGLADEMNKPQQATPIHSWDRERPNKFLETLGTIMKPLTYLDIPIELAAEVVEGVIPGQWWGEGTAEREDFEGWKAVFEGLKGQKSILDVADEIAHAFEKRPLLAQVGLGFAYGVPISRVGTIARLGKAAKPTMYALDPAQLVFDYTAKPLIKKGWKHRPLKVRPTLKGKDQWMRMKTGKGLIMGAAESQDDIDNINLQRAKDYTGATFNRLYSENDQKFAVDNEQNYLLPQVANDEFVVTKLTRHHKMQNAVVRLRNGLTGKSFSDDVPEDIIGSGNRPDVSPLMRARDLALFDYEQAAFGREGQIHNVTVRELEKFTVDGWIPLETKTKTGARREGFLHAAEVGPNMQARESVQGYLNLLKDTKTGDGKNIYDELVAANAPAFKAVDVQLGTDYRPLGDDIVKVGAFAGGDDANILTPRLRFYNTHYGRMISGGELDQPLPQNSQYLRAMAATRWAHSSDTITSAEIRAMLLHSDGSPDQWPTYVSDPEAIDTTKDVRFLFGRYFKESPDGGAKATETDFKEGYIDDFFMREFGVQRNSITVRNGEIVSKRQPFVFDGKLKKEMEGYGIDVEEGQYLANQYALTRSAMISAAKTKKGLRQAGEAFTKAHREVTQFHENFKFQRLYNRALTANAESIEDILSFGPGSNSAPIAAAVRKVRELNPNLDSMSLDARRRYEALVKVGVVLRNQDEAVQADISFKRLKNRQTLILKNLEKAGWVEKVGHGKYRLNETVNEKALADNILKYGEDVRMDRDEAWRLWGPYANASDVDDWTEMGDGWVGYERRFSQDGEDAIASFQNSYGGIQQQTRKLGHQLHAHEVMITGTVFRKGEVLNEWMQLYEQAIRESAKGGPFNPESHPLFSPLVISKLWDGVVDSSLATESLLAMPGVASKIDVGAPSLDLRWNRAINDLHNSISSGQMNPHQAMAIGAKRTREEMEDIFHAVMYVDENLSSAVLSGGQRVAIEDIGKLDESDIQDATTAVRQWLGIGVIDAAVDTGEEGYSPFLRANQDLIVQAKQRRRILESAGVTDGADATTIAGVIKELMVEDIGGVAGIFGSDIYKSPGVLNPDTVARRSEKLAEILVSSPDGKNTLLGEAGFQAVTPPSTQVKRSVKQRVLPMRRPYTPIEDGVPILGPAANRTLTEDELAHHMPHINDLGSTQIHNALPGPLKRTLLGLDADGKPLDVQNRFQKMMGSVGAFMAGGSAPMGVRQATRIFGARNIAYDLAENFGKSTKADLHLMLSHESTAPILGATRQAPSRIHREGTIQNPTYAQGRHAVGNRFYESLQVNDMEWNRGGTDITGRWADGREMSEEAKKWVRIAIKAVTEHDEFMEGMATKTIKQNAEQLMKAEYSVLELSDDMLEELFGVSSEQYKQLRIFPNTTANLDEKAAISGYIMQEEIIKAAENTPAGKKAAKYLDGIYVPRLTADSTANIALDRQNWNGVRTNDEFWLQGRTDENPMMQMARGVVYVDAEESLGLYVGNMNKAMADEQVNHALRKLSQYTYAGRGFNPDWVEYVDGEQVFKDDLSPKVMELIENNKLVPQGFRLNARDYYRAAKYDLNNIQDLEFTIKNVLGDTDITEEFTYGNWKGSHFDSMETATKVHRALNADWSHMGSVQTHIDNLAKAKNNEAKARYLMKEGVLGDLQQSIDNYKYTAQDAVERTSMSAGEKWQKMYNNQRVRWFSNIKMDKADLDEIDAHLSILQEGIAGYGMQAIAQGARPMSRFLRTFKAGFDAGVLLIHGYNALVKVPFNRTNGEWAFDLSSQKAWFKSAKEMVNFMRDPAYYEEYMATADNAALRREMAPYTKLGHSEPLALITESSSFQRFRKEAELIPVVGKARVAHRAEAAFVGTLDVLRMEMWKGMKETVKRDWERTVGDPMGLKWSDDVALQSTQQMKYMEEFGAVVNKTTGVYDQTKSMLKPTQGTIEQSLLFFAPMYRRATYGIIADIGRGGMRRREAIRQLSGVVIAGLTMGVLAEHAFGNEGASSPASGNFGKFVIAGQKMGVGTAWYTAFRLAADLAMGTEEMLEGDVEDYLKDNPIITALGRRGRSQLAPPAQILIDMMQGKNYIGEPLMDRDGTRDWSAHLRYAGKQVMPFWADSVLTGGKSGMLGGLAEAVGLQSMPVSDYDIVVGTRQYLLEEETGLGELNDWRAQQKRQGNKLVWSELPEKVRFDLETNNIRLIQAMSAYKEKWGDIARGDDRDWVDYASRKEDIDITSKKKIAVLTTQFEKGLINGRKLNQEVKSIKQYRRMAHAQLIGDPTLPAVSERFQELHKAGAHEMDTLYYGDLLYDDYMATVVSAENTEDDDGMYLPDSFANNLADFQRRHNLTTDSPMWQYIESKKSKWYQENPVLMELDASKRMLDPYWNIHKTLFKGEDVHKATRLLGATSDNAKKLMMIEDPSLKVIQTRIEQGRLKMRQDRPELDWELVKWHSGRPRTDYARAMEDAWESKTSYARNTGQVNSPDPEGYQRTGYGRITHSTLTGVQ